MPLHFAIPAAVILAVVTFIAVLSGARPTHCATIAGEYTCERSPLFR